MGIRRWPMSRKKPNWRRWRILWKKRWENNKRRYSEEHRKHGLVYSFLGQYNYYPEYTEMNRCSRKFQLHPKQWNDCSSGRSWLKQQKGYIIGPSLLISKWKLPKARISNCLMWPVMAGWFWWPHWLVGPCRHETPNLAEGLACEI